MRKPTKAERKEIQAAAEMAELLKLAEINGITTADLSPQLMSIWTGHLNLDSKSHGMAVEQVWGITEEGLSSQLDALHDCMGFEKLKELLNQKGNVLKGMAQAYNNELEKDKK